MTTTAERLIPLVAAIADDVESAARQIRGSTSARGTDFAAIRDTSATLIDAARRLDDVAQREGND